MELKSTSGLLETTTARNESSTTVNISKKYIIKNLMIICLSFLFVFSAFSAMTSLQSTINKDSGLGTYGLAILYGALLISSLFLPSFVISHLGCKKTIALSMVCFIVYMAANIHAEPYSIYPASVILGLGLAPLWSAESTYLTEIAKRYASLTGKTNIAITNLFFGLLYTFFHTAGVLSNVIAVTVLKTQPQNISVEQLTTCGPNFCPSPQYNNTNLDRPSDTKIYILIGSYLGLIVLGFLLVVLFLDGIIIKKDPSDVKHDDNGKISLRLLGETFRHCWKSMPQKLLIPLTAYVGVEEAVFKGEFTKAYVACSSGIWNVGYVMIWFSVSGAVCSFVSGKLVQYVGHDALIVFGAVTHASLHIVLLYWVPTSSTYYVLFVVAGLWGMGFAILLTQLNALYGKLFTSNTEAAFANYRLWESLGLAVTFAYSDYLSMDVKLYISIIMLTLGMMGYGCFRFVQHRESVASRTKLIVNDHDHDHDDDIHAL